MLCLQFDCNTLGNIVNNLVKLMSLRLKLGLFAAIPLVASLAVIGFLSAQQANNLSRTEVETLERSLIDAKKSVLKSYIELALNAIDPIYNGHQSNSPQAKDRAREILSKLSYGLDGYFFVYDYKGKNISHPRQPYRIGKNWWNLQDREGNFVTQDLINQAKAGGGFTRFVWEKPSTGQYVGKIAYAIGLQKWQWMIGTGLYIDDIAKRVSARENEITTNVKRAFFLVSLIAFASLGLVFSSGVYITLRERKTADKKLKILNKRVVETQEEERGRVARELHDGISQLLISVKYNCELAQIQATKKTADTQKAIAKAIDGLSQAILEVRRISRDLRPGILDDLGLSPSIKSLAEEFSERTGVTTEFNLMPIKTAITKDEKTAIFRVAQETFTNIERHSAADKVSVSLSLGPKMVYLQISDNGIGFDPLLADITPYSSAGIGLRNMRERMAYYDGQLDLKTSKEGTVIRASLPIKNHNHKIKMEELFKIDKSSQQVG